MTYNSDEDEEVDWTPVVASLAELTDEYPPYIAGTLNLPKSAFELYYKDKSNIPRVINFAFATVEQLDALMQTCQPASFGRGGEDVLDEAYRKAGKLDVTAFATSLVPERTDLARIVRNFLLEGEDNKLDVVMELHKLNIYGKDSFFKPHVDTPQSGSFLGSLVLVFPTPHRGGELVLRPTTGDAYTFDSGALLTPGQCRIGYAAFYGDVAHEVLPVTDGHRVTLTFNLYIEDALRRITTPSTISTRMLQCRDELNRLLRGDILLPDGGLLVFALQHAYPITRRHDISSTCRILKGVDRILFNMLDNMGLEPEMQLLYRIDFGYHGREPDARALVGHSVNLSHLTDNEVNAEDVIAEENTLRELDLSRKNVVWVTPVNSLTRIGEPYVYYGNQAGTEWVYGDLCAIAQVEPFTVRNEIPTSNSTIDDNAGEMEE